jgi:hypothetical protein
MYVLRTTVNPGHKGNVGIADVLEYLIWLPSCLFGLSPTILRKAIYINSPVTLTPTTGRCWPISLEVVRSNVGFVALGMGTFAAVEAKLKPTGYGFF